MMEKLKENVYEIKMPDEMRARIVRNCNMKMEEETMRKHADNNIFRKPMVAVASLALCICLTGISAMAATGKLQGLFRDITRWDGAVVGTSYEQATDEVEVKAMGTDSGLEIEVSFLAPDKAPYFTFEQIGIYTAKIIDVNGKAIEKDIISELSEVQDGKVTIQISLENVPSGNYKLQISDLVGSSKADQPLVLHGEWECEFVR